MAKGKLIVLEGIDGSGLTTQSEAVKASLVRLGKKALFTKEPTSAATGEIIRRALQRSYTTTPQELALLFAADRDHHCAAMVRWLEDVDYLICDRYVLSSLVYQGPECGYDWVEEINAHAMLPYMTIFVDVPPEIAAQRRYRRGTPEELFEKLETTKAAYRRFKSFMSGGEYRLGRKKIVDGTKPVEYVTSDIVECILGEEVRDEARSQARELAKQIVRDQLRGAFQGGQ